MTAIQIGVAEKDIDIIRKLLDALDANHPIHITQNGKGRLCSFRISDKRFFEHLEKLKINHDKTKKLSFPTFIPDNLIKHFIRGYFDGDGSVYAKKNDKGCGASICGNEYFIKGLSRYLNKNNIKHSLQKQEYGKGRMCIWSVLMGGTYSSLSFLDYLYEDSTIYLNRKFHKFKEVIISCLNKKYRREDLATGKKYIIDNDLISKYDIKDIK